MDEYIKKQGYKMMEGSSWHKIAMDNGAKLRPNMQKGKFYLYELFTTCFVEFDTLGKLTEFRCYANKNIPYWDYYQICIINTNNPIDVKKWENFMEDRINMDEYIKKQDVLNKICDENCAKLYDGTCNNCRIPQIISEINPSADVRPVVRGEWIECFEDYRKQLAGDRCSICGFEHYGSRYNFCPNCGADMRGK